MPVLVAEDLVGWIQHLLAVVCIVDLLCICEEDGTSLSEAKLYHRSLQLPVHALLGRMEQL